MIKFSLHSEINVWIVFFFQNVDKENALNVSYCLLLILSKAKIISEQNSLFVWFLPRPVAPDSPHTCFPFSLLCQHGWCELILCALFDCWCSPQAQLWNIDSKCVHTHKTQTNCSTQQVSTDIKYHLFHYRVILQCYLKFRRNSWYGHFAVYVEKAF